VHTEPVVDRHIPCHAFRTPRVSPTGKTVFPAVWTPLPAVSWPWVPACGSLEPSQRGGQNQEEITWHVVSLLGLRQPQDLRQQRELIEQVAAAEVASDTAEIVAVIVKHAAEGALAVAAVDESHSDNN